MQQLLKRVSSTGIQSSHLVELARPHLSSRLFSVQCTDCRIVVLAYFSEQNVGDPAKKLINTLSTAHT